MKTGKFVGFLCLCVFPYLNALAAEDDSVAEEAVAEEVVDDNPADAKEDQKPGQKGDKNKEQVGDKAGQKDDKPGAGGAAGAGDKDKPGGGGAGGGGNLTLKGPDWTAVDVESDELPLNDGMSIGGNLNNWNLYTGLYYPEEIGKGDTSEIAYVYSWKKSSTQGAKDEERILINSKLNTPDPIIKCSDFYINPDGYSVIQVGKNSGYAEGRSKYKGAYAERLRYAFVVNEQSTLFTYKYACVLHVPTSDKHKSYQMPSFSVTVTVTSPDGTEESMPCQQFTAGASFSTNLLQNPATCREAEVEDGQNPEDYVYQPWTTVAYDLTKYIGYTVTVDIVNHDCLVDYSATTEMGGSHKSYGYFWGKTEPLQLLTKNCGNDDAVITAPSGFETYVWESSDRTPISSTGNVAIIPQDQIVDGGRYSCTMMGSDSRCTTIQVDTILSTIILNPDFDFKDTCNASVNFYDSTLVLRDEVKVYRWDFGDGKYSGDANPFHEYENGGEYRVSLMTISSRGCVDSVTKGVKVNPKPKMLIDGDQNVCQGDTVALTCLSTQIGNRFFWLDEVGDTISKDSSIIMEAIASHNYTVHVVDQFNCEYTKDVYVGVSDHPTMFIKGDSAVCLNTPAKLWAWGDADTYAWGVSEGDTLHFTPQVSTRYCVTGTYTASGCKTQKCVNVKVNPLPVISIKGPTQVCAGDPAVLKASGAREYFWNNVYAGDSLFLTPTESDDYTVVGTDENGCRDSAKYRLVVAPAPALTVHGNHEICEGQALSLWVEGAQSYSWDDGTEGAAVTRTPSLNTYSYWVEGANGDCKAKLEIPIVVNPIPTVAIWGNNEICSGDTVKLFAQGADSYKWSTGEADSAVTKTLVRDQVFQVTGTTKGCSNTAEYSVSVHPIPSFDVEGPESVCAGALVEMNIIPGDVPCTYQWGNGFLGEQFRSYLDTTTLFDVLAKDVVFGCSNKRVYKVTVIPNPELEVSGTTTVCRGMSVSLSASGASSYEWSDGSTSNSMIFQPESNMSLWVKGRVGECFDSLEVPITLLAAPHVWVDGNLNLCQGDSLILKANGADSYEWNNLQAGDTYRSMPTLSSSVTVVGKNRDNGCPTKVEVPFTVSPIPYVTIDGADMVCENTPVTLTAQGEDLVQFIWSTGESNESISEPVMGEKTFELKAWNSHNCSSVARKTVRTVMPPVISYTGETSVCQGEDVILLAAGASNYTWTENSAIVMEGDRLVYTPTNNSRVTLIGSEGDCSATMDIYVTVSPMPTLNVMGNTKVCKNQSFTLTASGADEYVWSTGDTTSSISYSLSTPTTYMVKGRINGGCYAKKTIKVEVYPDLNVSLREVRKKGCPGAPTEVEMEAEGATYYVWNSEPYNVTISGTSSYGLDALIEEPTMVYVVGSDENGCQSTDSMWIKPKDHNDMTFQILPAVIEKEDPTVHFRGYYPKNTVWTWDPGDGSDELVGEDVLYTYSEVDVVTEDSFRVSMRARTEDGCIYHHSSFVYVWKDFWAPNVFTPNGDGLNDVFRFLGGEHIEDFHFVIYNRLGETVFVGDDITDEWDGNDLNGHPCPQEVYGWTVHYASDYKGIGKSGKKRGYVSILK